MNKIALGLIVSALAMPGLAAAQACGGAITSTISSSPSTLTGNSCQASPSLANVCQNGDSLNGAGVAIYQLNVGTANTGVTVTVTPTGFDPELAVMNPGSGCNSINTCAIDSQATSAAAVVGTLPNASAAGSYFIVVGDTGADAPGCGAFTLAIAGTLPVKLQQFSVQ